MYHTLSNVQRGEAVTLQQYIDNRSENIRVGLRSITFTAGWYNVEEGESVSYRLSGGAATEVPVGPGLYSFQQLADIIEEGASPLTTLTLNPLNGLAVLDIASPESILLTDGLLTLLGITDGLGEIWLDSGEYIGDYPVDFAGEKMLRVHLEEINASENFADGAPSTILATVGTNRPSFGDVCTVRVEYPEFKNFRGGTVSELKITIRDEVGKKIENHNMPIYVTLALHKGRYCNSFS